jgi:sugar phosphate isomerase/epimerase
MAVAPRLLRGGEERSVERIGLQLYTVREPLSRDVPGTLAAIAQAGYAEVETAGLAGLAPAQFAAELKEAGLAAPSAHVPLQMIEQQPAQLLELAAALGHRYLVLPNPQQRATLADYQHVADVLNGFGAACAKQGVQLAYHNHDWEFAPIEGKRPFDVLLERCDSALVKFELDVYWATKAGADPAALLRAAPERYPLCHVKDMMPGGAMADVGDGGIDFAALFGAGSGLRHWFVEHDNPANPLESVRRSAQAVRGIRF